MSNDLFPKAEAVAQRCSVKKEFLEISQNSQETKSLSLNKVPDLMRPVTLLKKGSGTGAFL